MVRVVDEFYRSSKGPYGVMLLALAHPLDRVVLLLCRSRLHGDLLCTAKYSFFLGFRSVAMMSLEKNLSCAR